MFWTNRGDGRPSLSTVRFRAKKNGSYKRAVFYRQVTIYHFVRRLFLRVLAQRVVFRVFLVVRETFRRMVVLGPKVTLRSGFFQLDGFDLRMLRSLALYRTE